MTTLSLSPEFPAPGRQVTSTFTLTESGSNFVRVWCTLAPTGSALDNTLNGSTDPLNRVVVFEGAPGAVWSYAFDKGGKYTFMAQEYLKGSGYGGGYEGDPNNATNEEKVGVEVTLTLYIGQRVTQPIGPQGNQATLVLWVWNDRIRATTKAQYGEDSPSIAAQSPTPIVKTAMESTTVQTALDALVDADLADVNTVGTIADWTDNLYTAFNSHLVSVGVHANDDTFNALAGSYSATPTQKAYQDFVNKALKLLRQHVTNDIGTADLVTNAFGPDSGEFHVMAALKVSDRTNIPLYESVGTFAEAYGAFVDLVRCFDAHQRNEDVHVSVGIYPILTPSLVMTVHKRFLEVLATATPSVPPAQSAGVQTLISLAGFKEG